MYIIFENTKLTGADTKTYCRQHPVRVILGTLPNNLPKKMLQVDCFLEHYLVIGRLAADAFATSSLLRVGLTHDVILAEASVVFVYERVS